MSSQQTFTVARSSRSATRFFRRLGRTEQDRIREAVDKICQNPWRNHRRHAIRYLRGKWDGYLEYRSNTRPIFRIIYRVSDDESHLLEIDEKLRHLG